VQGFTSPPVKLNLADLKLQKPNATGATVKVRAANGTSLAKKARQSSADAGDVDTDSVDEVGALKRLVVSARAFYTWQHAIVSVVCSFL
jgi:hypothetical protein